MRYKCWYEWVVGGGAGGLGAGGGGGEMAQRPKEEKK